MLWVESRLRSSVFVEKKYILFNRIALPLCSLKTKAHMYKTTIFISSMCNSGRNTSGLGNLVLSALRNSD